MKGFDATNGTEFFAIRNPNKCVYTSIFWDNVYQELFISDEKGYVTVLNVYQEKPLVHKQIIEDEKIKRIEIIATDPTRNLLVHTDFGVRVFRIKRG